MLRKDFNFWALFITSWIEIAAILGLGFSINLGMVQRAKSLENISKIIARFSDSVEQNKTILKQNQRLMKRSTAILEKGCSP
jgi:hypothetical protein